MRQIKAQRKHILSGAALIWSLSLYIASNINNLPASVTKGPSLTIFGGGKSIHLIAIRIQEVSSNLHVFTLHDSCGTTLKSIQNASRCMLLQVICR